MQRYVFGTGVYFIVCRFYPQSLLQLPFGIDSAEFPNVYVFKKVKKSPYTDVYICPTERDARTLFVKNLPFSATVEDLKEVFEDAVDVRLPPGQNGSNRG